MSARRRGEPNVLCFQLIIKEVKWGNFFCEEDWRTGTARKSDDIFDYFIEYVAKFMKMATVSRDEPFGSLEEFLDLIQVEDPFKMYYFESYHPDIIFTIPFDKIHIRVNRRYREIINNADIYNSIKDFHPY